MRWLKRIRPTKLVTCETCGTAHRIEEMHIAFRRPDYYFTLSETDRASVWDEGSDLAHAGPEHCFIRCVIFISVAQQSVPFGFGVWIQVGEEAYARYAEEFGTERQVELPSVPGVLANKIPGYEPTTLGIPVEVKFQSAGTRPHVVVRSAGHPLEAEQRTGITVDRVLQLHHETFS
jgi:hypothetical protein